MKKFFVLLTAVFVCSVSAADVNLLKNADFAKLAGRNPAQWQSVFPAGSFRVVTLDDSSKCLQFGKGEAKQQCMLIQRNLPLENGKKYLFSCEVQSVAENSRMMIYTEWRIPGADGKARHASVNAKAFVPASGQWQTVAFEIPVRPAKSEKPYLVISVPAGKVQIRKLALIEVK